MTESSWFWDGVVTGDAGFAPYSEIEWSRVTKKLYSRTDNQGAIKDTLNDLEVTTSGTNSVSINTGRALVKGWLYENSESTSLAIPTPVSNPRIDRIVIRKSQVLQNVRATRIAGTENASPTAPALTQVEDTDWDIPLVQARIETSGAITLTNEKEYIVTPLAPYGNKILIEEIVAGANDTFSFIFDNIPQIYKHLRITGLVRHTNSDPAFDEERLVAVFNDDDGTNYLRERLQGLQTVLSAGADSEDWILVGQIPNANKILHYAGNFSFFIQNYTNVLFKVTSSEMYVPIERWLADTSVWLDTSPITKIEILANQTVSSEVFPFHEGSAISLYGLL